MLVPSPPNRNGITSVRSRIPILLNHMLPFVIKIRFVSLFCVEPEWMRTPIRFKVGWYVRWRDVGIGEPGFGVGIFHVEKLRPPVVQAGI